ncbi:MAG: AAA family ATPase [Gammaproteobacteria bacterium]|nr:MAG: ParA family protein [Gammaproteobacteria bacterium]UCH38791.1 MAG: AAA family ATPase [Gammaproteobacteria bacterium]
MGLQRILVTNAKGGCGKTTIATNIASHYARLGKNVRLFDHDPQGSSLTWINRRSPELTPISGVDASKNSDHRLTRSWQLRVPPETDIALVDSPAGADMNELSLLFQQNDSILIPVLPSPIDIHATAHFIKTLLTTGRARQKMVRLAVVANRVRKNTLMYHSLERFLFSLNIPFISSLRDTQLYARAIEMGIGVQEISTSRNKIDKEQWAPIFRWLDTPVVSETAPVTPLFNRFEQ